MRAQELQLPDPKRVYSDLQRLRDRSDGSVSQKLDHPWPLHQLYVSTSAEVMTTGICTKASSLMSRALHIDER